VTDGTHFPPRYLARQRRERVFFEEGGYALFLDLLAEAAARAQVAIWGYA